MEKLEGMVLAGSEEAHGLGLWKGIGRIGSWGVGTPFLRAFNDWEVEEAERFMERIQVKEFEDVEDTGPGLKPRAQVSFFAWEATWGKALTLDIVQKRGWALANRCFMCLEKEENINHLLLHCSRRGRYGIFFLLYLGHDSPRQVSSSSLMVCRECSNRAELSNSVLALGDSRSEFVSQTAFHTSLAVFIKRWGFPIFGSIKLISQVVIMEFSDLHAANFGSSAAGFFTSPVRCPSFPLPSIASFIMSAYFAPAFFSHLLGKCLRRRNPILEVSKLGLAVVGTFAIVWWPYLHSMDAFLGFETCPWHVNGGGQAMIPVLWLISFCNCCVNLTPLSEIMKEADWCWESIVFKVGKGTRILFWMDKWCGNEGLSQIFPQLFTLAGHRNAKVSEVWDSSLGQGGWNLRLARDFNDWELEQIGNMLNLLKDFRTSTEEDAVRWKRESNGVFGAKGAYKMLVGSSACVFPNRRIWMNKVPTKVSFLAWEASWGKILTLDKLQRRGWQLPNRCFLCGCEEENANHIMLHCTVVKTLWEIALAFFGVQWVFPESVLEVLLSWRGSFVGKKRKTPGIPFRCAFFGRFGRKGIG
ncbi:putative dolichyl pyrophosphate Man9GlcNAc2 alpha-1,3-glucosyltransferase [Vitis vinifera]|uniref:Putative dolichyl pyrophosphate Man9GlcNAc2 alpha-1,3-glucosyltransferase n=1 Tax=Vitis vinifera TaxID=29760 RepID=A0A438FHU9_VITVI|nr:putative dolichyl pyrophosphate Man9GlcNAc2 alpha-1,3-glucosyltransferase [Vitis vinifera]